MRTGGDPLAGMRPGTRYRGRVRSFDDPRGLGVIAADGGGELAFHCTEIAGGTRTIDTGRAVMFSVRPGPGGTWEAASVEPRCDRAGTEADADADADAGTDADAGGTG